MGLGACGRQTCAAIIPESARGVHNTRAAAGAMLAGETVVTALVLRRGRQNVARAAAASVAMRPRNLFWCIRIGPLRCPPPPVGIERCSKSRFSTFANIGSFSTRRGRCGWLVTRVPTNRGSRSTPSEPKRLETLLSITPVDDGIQLRLAGCEQECYCGKSCELTGNCHWTLPARFNVGDTCFEVTAGDRAKSSQRPLETLQANKQHVKQRADGPGPSPITLSRWFYALGSLQRWGNCPQEFFVQAARCAVESIGLDGAIVVRRRDESWEIVASHLPMPELGIHCDWNVLDQLLDTPRTLFHGTVRTSQKRRIGHRSGGAAC